MNHYSQSFQNHEQTQSQLVSHHHDRYHYNHHPAEVTRLDAQIAYGGGTSSGLELLPSRLQPQKALKYRKKNSEIADLVRENGYLRQELIFYKKSRNAMMEFHSRVMKSYGVFQATVKLLSERMAQSEKRILEYWDIDTKRSDDDDLTVLWM